MDRSLNPRREVGGRGGPRRSSGPRLTSVAAAGLALTAALLAGCVANPPSAVENPTETKPEAAPRTDTTVTVAMDGIGRGFNPHLLADQSPTTSAVASLVLPSAFRYHTDPADPARADLVLDQSVLESAEVVSESPFAVEYRLQNAAQWSDGAPIAVEDFRYLWQRMISEPGVVDPAGYAMISDVAASGEGGKTVKVTFDAPYAAWQELFSNLLPAHLAKDSIGGFASALKDKVAVSGGQFKVTTVDRGRNEIVLDRNDRFWGEVATADRLVFRRAASSGAVTNSLRVADTQLVAMRGGGALVAQLSTVPGVRVVRELQPRVLSLTLNARSANLVDAPVREGLLGLLDPELLAVIGAQSEAAVTPVRSQLLAPSDPRYTDTAPAPLGRDAALRLLADAGYRVDTGENAVGEKLTLTIAAPAGDEIGNSVANAVADAWRAAGIEVTVSDSADTDKIYGESLLDGSVSAIVGWRAVGGDVATEAASRFGCEPTDGLDQQPPTGTADPGASATAEPDAPATSTTATPPSASGSPDDATVRPPSNLGGECDPAAQPLLDDALSGSVPTADLVSQLDRKMWGLQTTLPILQDSAVIAIGDTVTGAAPRSPIAAGLFVDVGDWARKPE